jgi:hypothetical protein
LSSGGRLERTLGLRIEVIEKPEVNAGRISFMPSTVSRGFTIDGFELRDGIAATMVEATNEFCSQPGVEGMFRPILQTPRHSIPELV